MKILKTSLAFAAWIALSTTFLHADNPPGVAPSEVPIKPAATGLRLPSIIGDHMVLQSNTKVPIWGWDNPGESVTVKAGSATGTTTADANGKWRVDLQGLKTSSDPITVTIADKSKTITLSDVLVGDVWFCSGQSNMWIPLSYASNAATEVPQANRPTMRLFLVFHRPALDPQDDCRGEWKVCTPDTAKGFSAIGYLFGKDISDAEHVPVGLIGSYSGGSFISSWMSLPALQAQPESKEKFADRLAQAQTFFSQCAKMPPNLPKDQTELYIWADVIKNQFLHDAWADNDGGQAFMDWKMANAEALTHGKPVPPQPPPPTSKEPRMMDGRTIPTMLFNGMAAPIMPYALKGVIWFQGESDRGIGTFYRTLFPQMIADWRQHWGQGDFPFIFVQLAGYTATDDTTNNNWAIIQEAQFLTLAAAPNTAMVVANDIGDLKNVHAHDKADVADRLALAARHLAYGENVVSSGPLYDSFKVDANKVHIKFKEAGSGLKIGLPPPIHLALFPEELSPNLNGFMISGADMNFVPAQAVIDGPDTVTVSSDQVSAPVAVRYSWGNVYGNLYNKENLPASPFRTDTSTPAPSVSPPPKPKTPVAMAKNVAPTNAPPASPTNPASH